MVNGRRRSVVWTMASLLGLPFVFHAAAWADEVRDIRLLETNLPQINQAANQLAAYAPVVEDIGLAVLFLGIVAGILSQRSSPSRLRKAISLSVGGAISVLTGVNSYHYVLDHATMRFLATDARNVTSVVREDIEQYREALKLNPPDQLSKTQALNRIARHQQKLQGLERQAREGKKTLDVNLEIPFVAPLDGPAATTLLFPLFDDGLPSVYAAAQQQQQKPAWVQAPPNDPYQASYLGIGACNTLFAAKEMARYDAMEHLAIQLKAGNPSLNLNALMNFVERNSEEAKNYFYPDASKIYWHHTLLLFNKRVLKRDVLENEAPVTLKPQWKVSQQIRLGFSGDMTVQAPAKKVTGKGRFEFVFAVSLQPRQLNLDLKEIRVYEDSSVGSTRWIFQVRANGAEAIAIPLHRYDDSGKPTRCLVRREEENRRATIALNRPGPVQLELEAWKP